MLTSNKHVRDWPAIFAGDEILPRGLAFARLEGLAAKSLPWRAPRTGNDLGTVGCLGSPAEDGTVISASCRAALTSACRVRLVPASGEG